GMRGKQYSGAMIFVVAAGWGRSVAALVVLWLRRPHSVLALWVMVVMSAWLFDIALAAMLNAGRFDLGFYAGRAYGLAASSFVLLVLLLENGALYKRLADTHEKHERRLEILREIDGAIASEKPVESIAGAVIQPLRELLGVA